MFPARCFWHRINDLVLAVFCATMQQFSPICHEAVAQTQASAPPALQLRFDKHTYSQIAAKVGESKNINLPPACNIATVRPPELLRENILRALEGPECSEIVNQLIAMQKKDEGTFRSYLAGRGDSPILSPTVQQMADKCLFRFEKYKGARAIPYYFGQNFEKRLVRTIGTFAREGDESNMCMGTVIFDKATEAFGILTAAHCLGEHKRLGTSDLLEYESAYPELVFNSLDNQKIKISVADDMAGVRFSDGTDLVIIPLTAQQNIFSKDDVFPVARDVKIWEPLYIFSVNPYLVALARYKKPGGTPLDTVSASFEPSCRVHAVVGSLLYHRCNDEQGMSGSAIFVARNGGLHIAGVVSTDAPKKKDGSIAIEACPGAMGAENIGVLFPGVKALPFTPGAD